MSFHVSKSIVLQPEGVLRWLTFFVVQSTSFESSIQNNTKTSKTLSAEKYVQYYSVSIKMHD